MCCIILVSDMLGCCLANWISINRRQRSFTLKLHASIWDPWYRHSTVPNMKRLHTLYNDRLWNPLMQRFNIEFLCSTNSSNTFASSRWLQFVSTIVSSPKENLSVTQFMIPHSCLVTIWTSVCLLGHISISLSHFHAYVGHGLPFDRHNPFSYFAVLITGPAFAALRG